MDHTLMHRIRQRAYEMWVANGRRDGEADKHWLAAEREVLNASMANSPAPPPSTTNQVRRPPGRVAKKAIRLAS